MSTVPQTPRFARTLKTRHIQFIAIGGAIGAGLFLGSGQAIAQAGPSVLLAYAMAGLAVFLMARALGELTLNRPSVPAFTSHVDDLVGHWAGFISGWSYWLIWVLVGIAEITAAGVFVKFWAPDFPQWITALITLAGLFLANRFGVRLFGEIEFALTLIKVAAIGLLILGGAALVVFGFGATSQGASLDNLWRHGGLFPFGMAGLLAVIPTALFSFGGTELVGVTAAEAEDPDKSVPKAINGVIVRILLFYVGSLAVIMAVTPWNGIPADESPFVAVLEKIGLSGAAGVINFVVLSAVISSCNSGIYATGRVLSDLASRGQAPALLARNNKRQLPANAITASTLAMLVGVGLNYTFPEQVFGYVMSLVAALLLWTWLMVVLAHFRFRRGLKPEERKTTRFPTPFYPVSNLIVIAFIALVTIVMAIEPASRPTFYTAVIWFASLGAIYAVVVRRKA
ncbi:amino acid permease [Caulobacter sp. NIBR2454]|uniref:amino acid permease n=1 Tax=Caulobacter sp. NIBR2454 TaxID=3015996 RepID=UPI0022B72584|nr:amino acid permease [Caulobacter sp. NIBR2454]